MSKRLLFICQHFYPETFRGNDIAFDMAGRGIEVTVICGIPNYPKGKFFEGYGLFRRRKEVVNGVRIIRVPIIPRGVDNKVQLIANYFSYFINACLYLPFHLLCNEKYDACFVQQLSPVMMSVPGVLFKKLTKHKLYTWVLDLWPESLKAAGGINNKRILSFFEKFAKLQYRYSDKILVSSNGFARNICSKGNYADKILHLPNWADEVLSTKEKKEIPTFPEGFNVVFTGNVGEAQDFDSIVEAAKRLLPEDNIHLVIVGEGRKKKWVEQQIEEYALSDRIILLGRFDISFMPSFYDKADCLLFALKDDEIFNITIPAKVQAYMNAGKPIVAMVNGDAAELIETSNCGYAVPASHPEKFVDMLRKIKSMDKNKREQMGQNGKSYCDAFFCKQSILDDLYKLIFC